MTKLTSKIAKRLLVAHHEVFSKLNDGWFTKLRDDIIKSDRSIIESNCVNVTFGDKLAKLKCEIADDMESQTVGLQKYASLPDDCGMIFPYDEPRHVSFHMGSVGFPIDLIFVGSDNRVTKIVSNIEPGTSGAWGFSRVSNVVESNGGFCSKNNITVGCNVKIGITKKSDTESNVKITSQEKYPNYTRKDINPKQVPNNVTVDRFKSKDLVDKVVDNQPIDGDNWDSTNGYDVSNPDRLDNLNVPSIRMSSLYKIK